MKKTTKKPVKKAKKSPRSAPSLGANDHCAKVQNSTAQDKAGMQEATLTEVTPEQYKANLTQPLRWDETMIFDREIKEAQSAVNKAIADNIYFNYRDEYCRGMDEGMKRASMIYVLFTIVALLIWWLV